MRTKPQDKSHSSPLSPTFPPSQSPARPDMLLNLGSPTSASAQGVGPGSPSYPPNSSRSPRSFKTQSLSAGKLRKDKGSKDRNGPLSPLAAPVIMDRHVPTYASMPGHLPHASLLQASDSVTSVSPPGPFTIDADPLGIPSGSGSGGAVDRKGFSKLSHHLTAPISAATTSHHHHGQDNQHLHHHHHHHHYHHRHSSADEEDGPEDSFFAHLRAECEDCHEILDSEAVLDRKSPRRRSNLPLPLSIEEEDREKEILNAGWQKEVDHSYRTAQSLEAEQSTDEPRLQSAGSHHSASTLAPLRAEDVLGQRKELWHDHEQEQVLGGFASLGVTPSKARDWDSGSSTGHGGRTRSNTESIKLGSQTSLAGGSALSRQYESNAGGIFDGGASSPRTDSHDEADEHDAIDARIAWPATLKARNSDPMETLDILSIEEMGMQSINMGNPDDWEGCIIGPVRPDAPTSNLRLASASEFCAASAGISWAVARFVGQPRKWIVTPLESLRPGQDEHQVASTEARTVLVTDHVPTQKSESANDDINFLDPSSNHGPNAKAGHSSVSAFAETTMLNLRFLRSNHHAAVFSGPAEKSGLASAPDPALILAHPDAHRKLARAALRAVNEGSAFKSHLLDSVLGTRTNAGSGNTASSLGSNTRMTLAERRRAAADSDANDFGGFYDPFDSESATLSSGCGSVSRHGSQNARGSASLSVSSGPSSRSGSSVVGLGFGSNTSNDSTQMRNGSVQSEKLNFSQSLMTAAGVFGAPFPITPAPSTNVRPYNGALPQGSLSTAAVSSSSYGAPLSHSLSPYPPSSSQAAKTLRRTRSKPALRPSMRDAPAPNVDSPPHSLTVGKSASSATSSPSMQPSSHVPALLKSGLNPSHPAVAYALSHDAALPEAEVGSKPQSRSPSFGRSPSYHSAIPSISDKLGTPHDSNAMAHTATLMPASSTSTSRRRAHIDLLGLDSVPRRSLTMTIPLPLFQLHDAPRPITRYLRITFVPFAAAEEDEEDSSVVSKTQGDHHHLHGKSGHATRLQQNHSQSSAAIPMPDDFELPMSPLLTPTATVPSSLLGMTPQASANNLQQQNQQAVMSTTSSQALSAPQVSQSWYRKIANAAGARGSMHNHEDGGNGGFSIGGSKAGESSSKDWFKRIGRHHDDSSNASNGPGAPMKSSATIMGLGGNSVTVSTASAASQKAATDFVHDRCRLPGRRRSGAEAFRVTALVMSDPTAISVPGASHPVSRTASANSALGGGNKKVAAYSMGGAQAGGGGGGGAPSDGISSFHVSPRQVQGAFSSSSAAAAPETPDSQSPSVESGFEVHSNVSGPTAAASASAAASAAAHSAASPVFDWSADLPEPGTFPVVLAYCDGSRARCLELVPEGWEAIGLGAGAAALGLPGFDAMVSPGSPSDREEPVSKPALPSGALGGVADLIMAACAAVMDV